MTFKPKLNESVNRIVDKSLIERSDDFVRNKSQKIKNIITNDDIECTFSPKLNKTKLCFQRTLDTSSLHEEENLEVGRRLLNYQEKYKKKLEEMKEIQKETLESFPFKPEINKNTYEILKQRDLILQEIKNKYSEENDKNLDLPFKKTKINEIPEEETSLRQTTQEENFINSQQVNLSIKCLSSERNELKTSNEYYFLT